MSDYYNQSNVGGSYTPYSGVMDVGESLGEGGGFHIEQGIAHGAMTAAEVEFVPNPNIVQVLYTHPTVVAGLAKVVEAAAKVAYGIAPWKTNAYRKSIGWAIIPSAGGNEPQGILYATDYKAVWIEFGTGPRPQAGGTRFPAYAPLRRAFQMASQYADRF